MSQVRILLRWILPVSCLLVFTTCASYDAGSSNPSRGGGGTLAANPCGSGVGQSNRNAPIVCVDDSGDVLSVHPDPIMANAANKGQNVMLHWWTRSGANALSLDIESGCVTDVSCSGGHCTARTLPVTERKQCKYTVWTDKHPRLDPDIVVDPCC